MQILMGGRVVETSYDDVKQRLSVLDQITLPKERDIEIQHYLQTEIEKYRSGKLDKKSKRIWIRIGTFSAASAAVICLGTSLVLTANHNKENVHVNPPLVNQQADQVSTSLGQMNYTRDQLDLIQSTASKVHVTALIPQIGTSGDHISMVKSGNTSLTVDYQDIWIIESSKPFVEPEPIHTQKWLDITNESKGHLITILDQNKLNTWLFFKQGATYISLQLRPGLDLTEQQILSIARSFQSI